MNPDDPLPELNATIAKSLEPPKEVATRCEATLDKMNKLFKLTFNEKKKDVKTGENMFKDE